jgi:tetratricopeptide (TPR) repeat protein
MSIGLELALAALIALPSAATAVDAASPKTVEDSIAALEKADPGSPEALNDRLEYAQFLVSATDVECRQRLDSAQSQLDTVAGNPAVDVVLPIGRARLADIRYQIHLASASCGADSSERERELRAALAEAQYAVDLYRDALDYQSMAVMQYDAGITRRMLGDDPAAMAALETAIEMDREYGFHQDEEDNSKLLALWQRPANSPGDLVPDPTSDFPTRTTTLKFAWLASDATLGIEIDHASISDGNVIRGSVYRLFKQHVHATHGGWVVSYEPGQIDYDVATWPSESRELNNLAWSFGRTLPLPGFEVGAQGDFKHVVNPGSVSSDQYAAVRALILGHTQTAAGASRLQGWVADATQLLFRPAAVEQNTAEAYDFRTGVWIGAKLEQGVWYNMSAPLTLSGARQLVLPHDIEFAYTRDLPCSATPTARSCVEIVVHATPQPDAIAQLLSVVRQRLGGHPAAQPRFWSTIYMRIVTDPVTLTPYVYDERRFWHIGGDNPGQGKPENRAERLVSTFTYP